MPRNGLGHWVSGTSGNPGGRPKPPDGLKTRLAELSPSAVERLGELLDSADERVRLEAATAILDRHLGRQHPRQTSACTAPRPTAASPH